MLQTVNYLSSCNKRFDFGVPLEDVFPPNDVHPRLKYLFEEAVRVYLESDLKIEEILRYLQGSLETRLGLKEKLVYGVNYNISSEDIGNSPGAYFWVIRHFLGLLPIPLLPEYSNGIKFDWISLSEKCWHFLEHFESERRKKCRLDHNIAENLNLLPFEHLLLLNVLIIFIRKLSQKPFRRQLNRKILSCLAKYYCTSICIRPYRPGYNVKDENIFPLFFYLLVRWREIEKNCRTIGHSAYLLESNALNHETYNGISIRDNWAQTPLFSPEVITIYKNVPYFCNNNNYLQDTGSQTEQVHLIQRDVQNSESALMEIKVENKLLEQKNEIINKISTEDNTSVVVEDEKIFMETDNDYKNAEFSFRSTAATSNEAQWSDIVKETMKTVKKVEEYIYDDYDTFSKEDYNQISVNKSKTSVFEKMAKIGWTYTSPKITGIEENDSKTEDSQNSYFKFDDVFDGDGNFQTNSKENITKGILPIKDDRLNVTFRKCNYSTPLCSTPLEKNAEDNEDTERKIKKNFSLKRFKINLDFFRVLTHKKATYSPSYDCIESKVRYKKMRNVKSSTL